MTDPAMREREQVVAWLRGWAEYHNATGEGIHANALNDAADAIQRGDHHTTDTTKGG